MSGALSGVKVVDLSSGVAGPMTAMLLADFGADVIKVERPSGDPGRNRPGFPMWNRNKRAMVMDVDSPAGMDALHDLLRRADMCIGSDGQGAISRSVDPVAVVAANPSLVYLDLPAFLGRPRWAGGLESPGMLLALTGLSLRQSSADGGPVEPVFPYILYLHGALAAVAGVSALIERRRSGHGQVVTVGGVHAAMVAAASAFTIDPALPELPADFGPAGPNVMYSWYRCRDGEHIFLATLTPKFERGAIEVLGLEDVLSDERIADDFDAMLLPSNRGWVRQRFEEALASRTSEEWLHLLREADIPAGRVTDRDTWWSSPLIDSMGMRLRVEDPDRGSVTMPANPVKLHRTPPTVTRSAPRRGEHAEATGWEIAPRPVGPPPAGGAPLAGLRVLDLGAILAGPFAGTLLAELGADVIKVEVPAGDSWRQRGMAFIRGQRGVALDLRSRQGRDVFVRLVRFSDVVIDNYRVGVLARLGIDYSHLRTVRPDIVTVSITGYGAALSDAAKPAFDALMQAQSGMLATQGGPAGPVLTSVPINDVTAAVLAALGAVVAIHHRQITGEGQSASVALAATAAFAQSEELVSYPGRERPAVGGLDHRGPHALDRCYRVADGWIRIQSADVTGAKVLVQCGILEGDIPEDDDELARRLAGSFNRLLRDATVEKLNEAGIPAVPVRRIAEGIDDPDYRRLEILDRWDRPDAAPLVIPGRHAWFSRTQHHRTLKPPGVGEHTPEVLEELGYSPEEVIALSKAGVVAMGSPMVHKPLPVYR